MNKNGHDPDVALGENEFDTCLVRSERWKAVPENVIPVR